MRLGKMCVGLGLILASVSGGCGNKTDQSGRDAQSAQKPSKVSVLVSTELKDPPRLTLGNSVLTPPSPTPQQVGNLPVTAQVCQVRGAVFLRSVDKPALLAVEVVGRKLYVIDHRRALLRFDIAPGMKCRLTLDKTWGKDGVFRSKLQLEKLSADAMEGQTTLVASSYLGSVVVRGGRVVYTCKARDQGHVALHPGGGWGLASFSGSDIQRLSFGPAACKGAVWHLSDLKDDARRKGPFRLVSAVGFFGDVVLVGGSLAIRVGGWHPQVIVAFDSQGRRRFQLGALTGSTPQRFGWVHTIGACGPRRICVLDSNANRLSLWDPTGRFQGAVSLGPLLGLNRGVVSDFAVDPRGAVFVTAGRKPGATSPGATSPKKNTTLHEGIIFRLRGLTPIKP